MTQSVSEIAAGLSAAQRRALPLLPAEPTCLLPIALSRVTRDKLVGRGILLKTRPPGFGMVSWQISPLGLAVRAHLEGNEHGE